MLQLNSRAWVEIDLGAVQANVAAIRALLDPQTALMAIVKADAYGHGAVGVSQAAVAAGASWLGVATVSEGVELRNAGITAPILILATVSDRDQLKTMADFRLQPTLGYEQQVINCNRVASELGLVLPVHLKIDTGMSRLGVDWRAALPLIELVQSMPYLELRSIYSHLATADQSDLAFVYEQQRRFDLIRCQVRFPFMHLSNTAAMLTDAALHYDMVRVGLGLYGFCPATHLEDRICLTPVMEVKARVMQIKSLPPGTGVSYGHSYVCDRPTKIAVLGIGYADGIPRLLSNRFEVAIKGQLAPQVGAVTMDQCMIDVTEIPEISVGEPVTVLGKQPGITAADWAATIGTIPWEILCGFKHRLPRLYLNAQNFSLDGFLAN
ncbi:MAG: alanine racemase [Pseudanabaenaceae cyanobacterium bins.68]|nr:alanine racemase [Pseudanabaenaceae cyanobacterium bins.68]